ncbi:hypothetical protein [Paenibacillus swuensis]|nr:hypothetical protein [Paenibacillus swuensis]
MLETEQYGEAVGLLEFLLQCQGEEERTYEEWGSLLNWLVTAFPHVKDGQVQPDTEQDLTENDILKEHVKYKTDSDPDYARKIIDTLIHSREMDKKLLALGQLSYIDHPSIDKELVRFAEGKSLHPLIQSKAVQTLKTRGVEGEIRLNKHGETITVDIEAFPMGPDDFPQQVREILLRVQEVSEVHSPALSYFAEETWNEFLFYVYGTSAYRQLLEHDDSTMDVWAAALHGTLLETMGGDLDPGELFDMYGIHDALVFRFEQAHKLLKSYVQSAAG